MPDLIYAEINPPVITLLNQPDPPKERDCEFYFLYGFFGIMFCIIIPIFFVIVVPIVLVIALVSKAIDISKQGFFSW